MCQNYRNIRQISRDKVGKSIERATSGKETLDSIPAPSAHS